MLRLGLFILPICLTACGVPAALPPRAAELNARGAEALAEGDLETAGARLRLALEYNPDFVEALTNLGLVELHRGNFERAEQLLNRSRRLNPDIAQTHHGLGVLAEQRGQADVATDFYREALAVDPGFVEARANLGRLLYEAGLYEHALVEFKLLSEAAPNRIEGPFGLASSLLELDRLAEVRSRLVTMRAQFGAVHEVVFVEARLLIAISRCQPALAVLEPLVESRTRFAAEALAWTGACALRLARPAQAKAAAEQALSLEPDHPLASYVISVALSELGAANARPWLLRALLLNPAHPELVRRLELAPPTRDAAR